MIQLATQTIVLLQSLLHPKLTQVLWNEEEICISAVKIFRYKNWRSFFFSNFKHGSYMHLYYNIISFIIKGDLEAYLESIYGTINFVLLLFFLSTRCSIMYISLGYMLMQLTGDYGYYTACAIDFSATIFALEIVALCEVHDRYNINGFLSTLAVWGELILIHLLVPNSSFMGHLGGILVGCLYSYTFVGKIIDNMIHTITGIPIIHEEQFYRKRNTLFT